MKLTRFAKTDDGTLGRMGQFYILEEEDQGNQRDISSIPAGSYRCVRVPPTEAVPVETFQIMDVPGRTGVKFHPGNTEEDTAGCPLIGYTFGALTVRDEDTGDYRPKLAVLRSRDAFAAWMKTLEGVDAFDLEIEEYDG